MKTILIVEDVEFNIDLLTQILEDDYNLIIAKDGAQGRGLYRAIQARPGIDGYRHAHYGWI